LVGSIGENRGGKEVGGGDGETGCSAERVRVRGRGWGAGL
jgi:hypothetical protein